jgi:hypothetical protein
MGTEKVSVGKSRGGPKAFTWRPYCSWLVCCECGAVYVFIMCAFIHSFPTHTCVYSERAVTVP